MGRGCTMDEWVHFKKLPDEGRVPNSSYWYVLCRHCVAGYERKHLFNAPSKLTGRRSAMRAHLRACPMYATQYEMEQEAAVAAKIEKVVSAAGTTDTKTITAVTAVGEKRKRKVVGETNGSNGGRGKHCIMKEWGHFTRLQEEGYIGKSNFFYAVCMHCQRAYDEAKEEEKPLLKPEKLVGRREKMRKHLSVCPHFKENLPPLERRNHLLGNGSAVLGALAAGARARLEATLNSSPTAATGLSASDSGTIPTTAMTRSSRLALDEWHFFTRLERKKNSAYYYARCNFCQHAFESAPSILKTSLEPSNIMGRKSNMQTHLSKCPHVPKDALVMAKNFAAKYSPNLRGVNISTIAMSLESSEPKLLLKEIPSTSPDISSVHRALVQLVCEHHLHFEWVESESAKALFCALVPYSDATINIIPSAIDLRTRILDGIYHAILLDELTKLQELIPLEVSESACHTDVNALTIEPVGSWPVMIHCNLTASHQVNSVQGPAIDGVATNGKVLVPLSFVRAQQPEAGVESGLAYYHGLEVARWLDEHIRLCFYSSKVVPAIVVLSYSTMTQRAVGILRAPRRWPNVVFLSDLGDMLRFPLLKLLATTEMFNVVSSLIEVWQLKSIRSCVMERLSEMGGGADANPFRTWESCATLIQVLLDEKTYEVSMKRGTANVKKLVENALNRSLLECLFNLLHAFIIVFSHCRDGLSLTETMVQLGALFSAAEGFATVQLALEVVWEQMEQPLYVVAHALNPHLRLRDFKSTAMTKVSTLSDLCVSYFEAFFGRKPISLRGEVTAYLHTSQRVFTSDFVAEFPVVEDYFRYLSDNYSSLSMLMKVLHSFSSVLIESRKYQKSTKKSVGNDYTSDEQRKLNYLRRHWEIFADPTTDSHGVTQSKILAHNDRSGAALLNAGAIVGEWKEALESKLRVRGVEFSYLDKKFDGVDDPGVAVDTAGQEVTVADRINTDCVPQLPTLKEDDELAYPSSAVKNEFVMKVPLKDLFKSAEATI